MPHGKKKIMSEDSGNRPLFAMKLGTDICRDDIHPKKYSLMPRQFLSPRP